jgi:hypothetical protein
MADIQIGVNQGDTVYYYDQSIGTIVSRDWLFIGGTPTGGTSYGPAIKYNSANSLGYSTSLYVTDAAGITGIATKNNIIVVFPEVMTAQITATPSSSYMSNTVNYQSTGLTGTGYVSYNWSIPGLGATSGSLLSSVSNLYTDWYILTGSYTGLPGSSYTGTATLAVTSNVGNNANAASNVTFYKIGPSEDINYNDNPYYPITGPYYTCSVLSANSTTIGLGGSNVVLKIDQNSSHSGQMWDNLYFHSTNEYCDYYPNNDDLVNNGGFTFGVISFKTIFSGASLTLAGATYAPNPSIDLGNYINSGFINTNLNNTFYITDYPQGGVLTDAKVGNREWSNNSINEYMSNKYYLTTSSKYIENGGFGSGKVPLVNLASVEASVNGDAGGYTFGGGYGVGGTAHGPCVPSSKFFEDKFGASDVTVDAGIEIETETSSVYQFVVILSDSTDAGNTPDTYLITAQDTVYGTNSGLVSRFNTALGLIGSSSKLSEFIGFDQAPYFAAYENGGATLPAAKQYDSLNFPGIRLYVKDPFVYDTGTVLDGQNIKSVKVNWGPGWNANVVGQGYFSDDRNITSSSGSIGNVAFWNSWLGFNSICSLPFIYPVKNGYLRGWRIGGAV